MDVKILGNVDLKGASYLSWIRNSCNPDSRTNPVWNRQEGEDEVGIREKHRGVIWERIASLVKARDQEHNIIIVRLVSP